MATQLIDNQYFTNNLKVYSNICKAPSACINNLHLVPAAFTVEKIIGYFDNPLVDPNAYVNCNSQSSQTKTGSIGKDEKLPNLQSSCNLLCNKDFEDDKLVQNGAFGFFHQDLVSCWSTTATDQQIEIWGSGFGGVPAYSGNQFVELNANMVSTLFQNFTAALGGRVQISFAHRGRAGTDVLSVEIGPVGGILQNLGNFSADRNAWKYNTINYTFPDTGKTNYTLRFKSVSAAGGATVGNFLDAISISLPQPSASFTIIQPNCPNDQNGIIKIQGKQGSPPYKYNWLSPINSMDSTVYGVSPGVYQVEINDFYGCSETLTVRMDSNFKSDSVSQIQKVCESYKWPANGQTYTQDGLYYTVLKNLNGCDSILNLDLEIFKVHFKIDSFKICHAFTWPITGKTYYKNGRYHDTLKTIYGCDSIFSLNLEILPENKQIETIKICNSYTWQVTGLTYTQSGIYSDTFTNAYGCDSILVLDLQIWTSNQSTETIKKCESYSWPINGQTYTKSGFYYDTLKNVFGCDSILTLDLDILPITGSKLTVKNCESYVWLINGKKFIRSGIYSDTLTNIFGCDSILLLDLEIFPSFKRFDTIKICESYTWPVTGKHYLSNGIYTANFLSQFGCDSSYYLKLEILESTTAVQTVSACNEYTWSANGINYLKSGTYPLHLINKDGCDSILFLNLEIHPEYRSENDVQVCDSYTWPINGKTYNKAGKYLFKFNTNDACDSIFILNLKINPNYTFYDTASVFDHFIWPVNQKLYDQSGVFHQLYKSVEGCDSLRILLLEIKYIGTVYVPNVFTPNGDGINDQFTVFASKEINTIDRLRIFNRWGELLYELLNFPPNVSHYGWDGNFQMQKMLSGVYIYTIDWTDLKGEKHIEFGDVTLIR
ncbi:MAG: gliding motility-associated C-terminal domain-containing protein [Saprospiraceae bacterium]|nr:gliding motility-associated C-terminal domain-containing protein [Saprospiraceae bacterium]